MLENLFRLSERKTDVRTELIAGATTFMTMAYIIFVNPGILSAAGVPFDGAVAATCFVAGGVTLMMGLWTNYPFALASGMGLNAALVFGLVLGVGMTWRAAMAVIFLEGCIVLILVLVGLREAVMEAIPVDLRRAIGVGIGIFIAFIGLNKMGIIAPHPVTRVTYGVAASPHVFVAFFGLVLIVALMRRRVPGAILIGILASTALHIVVMLVMSAWLDAPEIARGALPEKVFAAPVFSTFGKIDIPGALSLGLTSVTIIFSFLMVDFFDTLGTVTALGGQGGFTGPKQKAPPGLGRVLIVDSVGAMAGGFCGASSATTYIESAAGIGSGGRTGLTAVTVSALFFAAAFFAPVVKIVPDAATAPALIVVGYLMMTIVKDIDWKSHETALAAFVIMLGIPLTYSISHGIGYGVIVYAVSTLFTGSYKKTSCLLYVVALFFLASFLLDDYSHIRGNIASGAYSSLPEHCGGIKCWLKYKCMNPMLQ